MPKPPMTPRATRPILFALALATGIALLPASAGASRIDDSVESARAPESDLTVERRINPRDGARIVRLQQRLDGIPVLGGEAVITDSTSQPAELVTDGTHAGLEDPPKPRIGEADAIDAALADADIGPLSPAPRAALAIEPGDGGTLVWRVLLHSTRPSAAVEVLVDARSGEVLRTRDLLQDVNGKAKVFDPNPIVTNGGFAGLRDKHDRATRRLNSLRIPVKLQRLTNHQNCTVGKFVRVTVKNKKACHKHRRFSGVTRDKDSFEALMAYHHIDRTQAYVQSLEVGPINNRSQRVRVNQFKDDNSFFDPIDHQIRYGRGGVDDAEDGDVIVHEYGHALQDDQVADFGATDSAGTVGEGFGDYVAAMMSSRSPGTDNENDVCIFEWDSTSYAPPGTCDRRADDPRTLSQAQNACRFEIHCVGQVWSSALWKLRTQLGTDVQGRSVMDRVVLYSNFLLVRTASFQQAGQALLGADAALYPAGPGHGAHENALRAELVARGFLAP
jgi:Zn-dependent metalloprotease